jgi:hypothetical protein
LSQFLSAVRKVDTTSMVASVTILMSLVFFTVYDSLGSALFTWMIAIGSHARSADQPHVVTVPEVGRKGRPRRGRDLADYARFLRRNGIAIAMITILGGIVGGAWAMTSPTSYTASTTVLMLRAPVYVDAEGYDAAPAVTIDTDAQLSSAPGVARRVSRSTGVPARDVDSRLLITAAPLTRVLEVSFQGRTPQIARDGSQAAATGMLHERKKLLVEQSTHRLARIRLNLAKLQNDLMTVQLEGTGSSTYASKLADRIEVLQGLSAELQDADKSSGRVISSARVVRVERGHAVTTWAGSSAALAFLCALAIAWFLPISGRSLLSRGRRSIPRVWEVSSRRAR